MVEQKSKMEYIASLCMELHLLLGAGIPVDEGIGILRDEEVDQNRNILEQVYDTLLEGHPLHLALEQTGAFPKYMVDMVRVGEETGNLDRGLLALSNHYRRQEQLSQNIRKAILYPAVLLSMLTIVMVVLIVEVLPMFQDVYAQLGGSLSGLGAVILNFGVFLKEHWVLAIGLVSLLIGMIVILCLRGQKTGERVLGSRTLGTAVATAKVASCMSMAFHSGLDLDRTMELTESLTQHPELSGKLQRCQEAMAQGVPFAKAIGAERLFSSLHCRMLSVAMSTGTMDQVMEDLASRCDASAQNAIDRYVGNVEPTLIVIMSALVGVVLLSVMLPLASIMSALG